MNSGDITGIIKFALRDLFQEDSYLLYNDVSEWSICSKLAWHLLANLKHHQTIHAPMGGFSGWPDLTADIDFNRDRGPIPKATQAMGQVIPDIILHERGTNRAPEVANLLAIEVNKAVHTDYDKIEAKIKVVSYVADPLHYRYALYLSIDTDVHNPRVEEARLVSRDEYGTPGKPSAGVFRDRMRACNLRIQDARRARPAAQRDCSEEKRRMEEIQEECGLTLITDAIQPTTTVP